MFSAAHEALLALIALAGERVGQAADPAEARHWQARRDEWTRRWRELDPRDLDKLQEVLVVDAALLRQANQ